MNNNQGIRVLIAEDNYLVSKMVKGLLTKLGYIPVGEAINGLEAVELTRSLRPDVILMDIQMPDMDGIQAAQRIYESCPTPVVVLTAYETPELVAQASIAKVGAYLVKPPNAREIERAIAIAMARFDDMMELRQLNDKLQQALAEIKTLQGFIPICANCKKVRDDEGFWTQIETYIRDHSEAEFSHSICPSCAKELYPGFYEDDM